MKICTIEGCGKELVAKGLCAMHYYRLQKNGDPNVVKQEHVLGMSKDCEVVGCKNKATSKGLCSAHYRRLKLYGDPTELRQHQFHNLTVEQRFWKYVKKEKECWKWLAAKDSNNYGRLMIKGIPVLATRLSWTLHNGDIPKDKMVLHKCDNPECVNPEHLYLGSQFDNVQDMWNRGRARPGHLQGEKHGMSKLNNEMVLEIRRSKGSCRSLAVKYGVSAATINDVRRRKIWTHIP